MHRSNERTGSACSSSSCLLGLSVLLFPCVQDLPDIALPGDPLLHFNVQLAQLFLLRICFLEKGFLALLQRLSLVFQLLTRGVLVLNPRNRQVVFVARRVLWVCGEELFGCRKRETIEGVAVGMKRLAPKCRAFTSSKK